jgi:hypoxanthine phosphoribosyltransferase
MHKDLKEILVSEEQIEQRCKELGAQITQDYKDLNEVPVLVSLLKGSVPFLSKLMPYIDLDVEIDFMDVSSYEGTESIGDVRILKDLDRSIKGESILLVEDIADTGRTLHSVTETLRNKGAKRLQVVSLLDKPSRRVVEVDVDYIGFTIPNLFVVGFGLDFNEKYRNLPYVGILKDELYL